MSKGRGYLQKMVPKRHECHPPRSEEKEREQNVLTFYSAKHGLTFRKCYSNLPFSKIFYTIDILDPPPLVHSPTP